MYLRGRVPGYAKSCHLGIWILEPNSGWQVLVNGRLDLVHARQKLNHSYQLHNAVGDAKSDSSDSREL